MASSRLPLPARGQPIDVPFIYDIVDTVNSLANDIADSNTNTFSSVHTREKVNNLKTANIRVAAKTFLIESKTVASDSVQTFTISFDSPFLQTPVVTMTLQNEGGQNFASGAVISAVNITDSLVNGQIYFPKGGSHQGLRVQMIAVGVGISQ
jgi:phage baseplate assembly protein gpV